MELERGENCSLTLRIFTGNTCVVGCHSRGQSTNRADSGYVLTSSSRGVEVPVHPVVEGEERRGGSHLCTHVADGGHAWERRKGRGG